MSSLIGDNYKAFMDYFLGEFQKDKRKEMFGTQKNTASILFKVNHYTSEKRVKKTLAFLSKQFCIYHKGMKYISVISDGDIKERMTQMWIDDFCSRSKVDDQIQIAFRKVLIEISKYKYGRDVEKDRVKSKNKGKCVIMIGCPGSGKTYKAKEYEEKGYFRISQDDQGKGYHKLLFETALEERRDVVVDRMNFSREQREIYAKEAKKNRYVVTYHRMMGVDEECLERCATREEHPTIKDTETAKKVIKFFHSAWEDITQDEAFDELIIDG